ncbi:hypothetical protein ACQRIU_005285 [Beauveria bassiana]
MSPSVHLAPTTVVIIGAGFAGICMASTLQLRLSVYDYCIYDRNADIGGRRIFNKAYTAALHRSDVDVVRGHVTQVQEFSVVLNQGQEIDADIIVFATGFETSQYDTPMQGSGGETRLNHWKKRGHKSTYKSVAMSGFPNMFFVLGPNSGRLHTSTLLSIEWHSEYITRVIKPIIIGNKGGTVQVRARDENIYQARLLEALKYTVHDASCSSILIDKETGTNCFDPIRYLHRGDDDRGLKYKLNQFLKNRGEDPAQWPYAYLVSVPRFLCWSRSVVSWWYLYAADRRLDAVIMEINNSFDEKRPVLFRGGGLYACWVKMAAVRLKVRVYGECDFDVGSFGSGVVWDANQLFPIPETYESAHAAALMCAGASVWECLQDPREPARPSERVGVLGIGGLGHLAIKLASAMGCEVIALSRSETKREAAMSFGANEFHILDMTSEVLSEKQIAPVKRLLLCSTSSAMEDLGRLMPLVDTGGIIYPLGVSFGELKVPLLAVMAKGLRIQGSRRRIYPTIMTFPLTSEGIETSMRELREGRIRYKAVLYQ